MFRKKALSLGIPLYTQETLLKYIGGLHVYLRHFILMFNPFNFDEVCIKTTHIESSGRNTVFGSTRKVPPTGIKRKGKEKRETTVKKEEEKPTCSHCQRKGHEEAKCWKLHPEFKPKWFKDHNGKQKTAVVGQDLASDSDDETKITTMGWKGKTFVNDYDSGASCASTSKDNVDNKRNELFHTRVIAKHTKIDTLIDGGSQVNLISEEVVKKLGLETKAHNKPYPLG